MAMRISIDVDLAEGARASARFIVRTTVVFKMNSNVSPFRTLKRRERRNPNRILAQSPR